MALGFSNPRVFDAASAADRGRVALGGGSIARVDADGHERRVIVVDVNRSAWVDPATWVVLDRREGRWQDAAMAPDGTFVAALDFADTLYFAILEDRRFRPIGERNHASEAAAVPIRLVGRDCAGRDRTHRRRRRRARDARRRDPRGTVAPAELKIKASVHDKQGEVP